MPVIQVLVPSLVIDWGWPRPRPQPRVVEVGGGEGVAALTGRARLGRERARRGDSSRASRLLRVFEIKMASW